MSKRQEIQAKREQLEINQLKRIRAVQTLEYYAWLEEWGLTYDQIKIASHPFAANPKVRRIISENAKALNRDIILAEISQDSPEFKNWKSRPKGIAYQLHDGRDIILPFPPFPYSVVYSNPDPDYAVADVVGTVRNGDESISVGLPSSGWRMNYYG